MPDKLARIIRWIAGGLMAVGLLATVWFVWGISDVSPTDDALAQVNSIGAALNFFLGWSYWLLALAVVLALASAVWQIAQKPQLVRKTLPALLGLLLIVGLAWLGASDTLLDMPNYDGTGNNPLTLRWTDTGLLAAYVLLLAAGAAIAYAEISKMLK